MTETRGLTKAFGQAVMVGLTFAVRSGEVTGFPRRNSASKTTTLRMVLGPRTSRSVPLEPSCIMSRV